MLFVDNDNMHHEIVSYELRQTPGVLDNPAKLKELKVSGNPVARS